MTRFPLMQHHWPRSGCWVMCVIGAMLAVSSCSHRADPADQPSSHVVHEADDEFTHEQASGAAESMHGLHVRQGAHFRWTALRSKNPEDDRRAEEIVAILRRVLVRYRDSTEAVKDGYEPFLPHVAQEHYHFTNNWNAFKGAFRFDPEQPTSLLYKRTPGGYELEGAMYTAPKRFGEERLHQRVPLSVARWHAHVNLCFPKKSEMRRADWTRFGFRGSIASENECSEAGGRFYPQLFGWMLHVHPLKDVPSQIWTH